MPTVASSGDTTPELGLHLSRKLQQKSLRLISVSVCKTALSQSAIGGASFTDLSLDSTAVTDCVQQYFSEARKTLITIYKDGRCETRTQGHLKRYNGAGKAHSRIAVGESQLWPTVTIELNKRTFETFTKAFARDSTRELAESSIDSVTQLLVNW